MKARIRDFLQTRDGWIFAVADYQHPEGIRCLLRYVPDPAGERATGGVRYRKLDFDDSFDFLRKNRPEYLRDLHTVPENDVLKFYRPEEKLPDVAAKDARVRKIADLLAQGGIPMDQMGITGSMLMGLNGPTSDIDFVVYGPYWWKARDLLDRAKAQGRIEDLDETMWKKIYAKRKPEISFQEFMVHERRKGNRGVVEGTYFDLLFTRDWPQIDRIEPRLPSRVLGRKKIEAKVLEADYAFDSPAIYRLDGPVEEIYCFSHTYAGQALPGETIEASGVIEETEQGLRMVVGTTREARGEWIRSLTLLQSS